MLEKIPQIIFIIIPVLLTLITSLYSFVIEEPLQKGLRRCINALKYYVFILIAILIIFLIIASIMFILKIFHYIEDITAIVLTIIVIIIGYILYSISGLW